jgi:hypothetical protein
MGVLDERFNGPQRLGQSEQPGGSGHGKGGVLALAQSERDHAPEAAHLAGRNVVAWVRRQPGVIDVVDARVQRQQLDYRLGVGAMAFHAHRQGLDAPQDKEAVERAGDGTGGVLHESEPGGKVLIGGSDEAPDHIAVPAQVLGR